MSCRVGKQRVIPDFQDDIKFVMGYAFPEKGTVKAHAASLFDTP
jgi:hypothetical protein